MTAETDITTNDLIAFAEACVYAKDWENGWQLFMLGWAKGRGVNFDDILLYVTADSKRYRKRQGQVMVVGRKQLARWAERFLTEREIRD